MTTSAANIQISLTREPIDSGRFLPSPGPETGAFFLFTGHVRAEEDGETIRALVYESYDTMAVSEMRRLAQAVMREHPIQAATIVHRIGPIQVGEIAILISVCSRHRIEGLRFVEHYMDRLKVDVPIWKTDVVRD